ncbi:regulator of nucleoside diphosphate kinase [[Luteovulum] sphaeroides subsp. megalophilum]|uniref:Regulator of nucleoside diphosphate kinase n=1 Tax=Cereibacter johrii TaxID=445629 RepID=A0ABX5J660_9RHOB|nr:MULTISPECIES: nucleoside diphosphate kinase regulator [Cereibacter]RDS95519.1 nucleoside diphosphate kinase regulator [Cereibacter sphaeroides f. sp. denitrificans]MEA5163146.1 nucleoside diphosphate kinase regulator [Cereibacter johrii]ODM45027.1 nucleoside-diphosphate kinase [Cereibacter johrii]PTM75251.1 regulator of nucleoside diphosphate kinase [Cereibacter johrii]SNT36956.1 regulator of nucleoside diphosphate kinase [[Luteovulum] sphaeroides subsp. megalophilum]
MCPTSRRSRPAIDMTLIERLDTLAGAAIARLPDVAYPLITKLTSARLLAPARLPSDVVTIGSEVLYHDDQGARDRRVTLSWPEDADISRRSVSILTPVGVALLGLSAGDRFQWQTRAGERRSLTVLQVGSEPRPAAAPAAPRPGLS